MDRRQFASLVPALLTLEAINLHGQSARTKGVKPLSSGVFVPGVEKKGSQAGHVSRAFALGLLKAGNIRLEMHESTQTGGAEHEPVGTHLHNEIWFVQKGSASLYINGTEHAMQAGDVGLVCAGDEHWIKNVGDGDLSYFVLAVGPPE